LPDLRQITRNPKSEIRNPFFPMVIVGGGISGLSAAYYLAKPESPAH